MNMPCDPSSLPDERYSRMNCMFDEVGMYDTYIEERTDHIRWSFSHSML